MALVMTKLLIALQVLSFVSGYPEITRCSDQICTMYCEHGFERDENGCEICECKQGLCNGEVCPEGKECRLMEINCQNSIPVGGSPSQAICDLKEKCMPECSDKQCKMYCHLGFERDENGCEVCKCKQELCNGQVCPDGTECRLVETNCQNSTSIHYSDSHPDCQLEEKCLPECVRSPCKRACKNGYVKDEYGCDTCQCLQELCNGQVCPEGTECQLVEVNCRKASSVETCDCMVAASEPVCELEDRCMPVPSCPDYDCIDSCDFGYVKDEHGCETCECLSGSNTHGEVRDNLFKKKVLCSDCEINSVPARTLAYVNLDGSDNTDNEINIRIQTVPRINLDHLFAGVTASVPSCPDYDCQDPCDSGYVKDEHGCKTCECLSANDMPEETNESLSTKTVPCSDCETKFITAQTLAYANLDDDLGARMTTETESD